MTIDRRIDPRRAGKLVADYRAGDGAATRCYLANVSRTGAFVVTKEPPPTGTQLELTLQLPDGAPLKVSCEIAWTSRYREAPGMGVRFAAADVERLEKDERFRAYLSEPDR
jgi:uncharacterized protein (TIGR02266 family)